MRILLQRLFPKRLHKYWKKVEKKIFDKVNILDYKNGDYSIPKNWRNSFKENLVFPSNQIGLGFKIEN